MKKICFISLLCIISDQIIKILVTANLKLFETITIIKGFFNLTYVRNIGAAWSILGGNRIFFILGGLIAIVVIYYYFIDKKQLSQLEIASYAILIGGIIGNMIDRIVRGYVIDYLQFNLIGYRFPIFNLADCCIVISVIIVCFSLIRGEKDDKNRSKRSETK